ncbi:MAG TPA: dimethyl sulfoxide reductase anchor subunit [Candidatus Thiothrix moscowensis]|uniref:dimethyl sulfoxide reductase anchor subunit family protein n=1 Tax=unclassified Thiothrix TaxID=2636184 RepID=UPI0025CCDE31|nr:MULTISPECIES: DmsC/YnfH family molybdoenzyme membrane anchor subunit [unclassified Thiothrix]HRJ54246.1 dimethyl sulfoxide reductase anchor subunit [Candidatus Thiothrix moscowensis]HRJ94566.1 dimethyl sulfoxide reductase anchor subunit [Candidatus Thiothrix moscowensis]
MNPAFSVIFLTTLIGAGQGLFLALYTSEVYNSFGIVGGTSPSHMYATGILVVMLLMGLGLFASFFHLGRPERAWRAATMWRTSWLAREVIVLPAFTGAALVWGTLHYFGFDPVLVTNSAGTEFKLSLVVGFVAALLAFLLYLCTGMIYAAVKFIQEWATPLTVINYTLLGLSSGFMLAATLGGWYNSSITNTYVLWALVFTLLGFASRMIALRRNARIKRKTTICTALGVRHQKIRQISQGAMGGSFNTREFFHHQSPQFVHAVKVFFLIMTFIVPVTLVVIGWNNTLFSLLAAAAVVQYVGLLAERWFFFAQANHPQNLYYQAT